MCNPRQASDCYGQRYAASQTDSWKTWWSWLIGKQTFLLLCSLVEENISFISRYIFMTLFISLQHFQFCRPSLLKEKVFFTPTNILKIASCMYLKYWNKHFKLCTSAKCKWKEIFSCTKCQSVFFFNFWKCIYYLLPGIFDSNLS